MPTATVTRRGFLKTSGALVITFSLGSLASRAAPAPAPAGWSGKTVALDEVEGFVSIGANGKVTIFSGKVDLGTGVRTAMTQIAAEELTVPFDSVEVIQGDTLLTPDQGTTWGSLSIQNGGMQIRQAAATAREALLTQGAQRLGIPREDVEVRAGRVVAKSTGKSVAYGTLIGRRTLSIKVDPKAPLKDPSKYTIVGTPVARLDIPGKVTGRFTYMQDFKLPGMLHARVVRPQGIKADLLGVDDTAARKIPGYVATVHKGNFLAVAATTEWGAIRAATAIKATWSEWQGLPDEAKLWEFVRASKVAKDEVLQTAGKANEALKSGTNTLSATYDFAIHTHGSIGPSCAVAEFKDGKLVCWSASQATHLLRRQLAQMLNIKETDVRCIYIDGSGCYGRNGHEDAAADAVLIAKELGKPVRVQWSRADEHGWDPKGPPTLHDHHAALGEGGIPVAWVSEVFIPNRPPNLTVPLIAAELAGLPRDPAFPGNIQQALAIPYGIPNIQVTAHWLSDTPLRPSWIRTPGRMQNTFANESFLDECAAAARLDPIEYRRTLLKDARGLELLDRLVKLAAWTPRAAPPHKANGPVASGRGVAYVKYELVRTYVGAVADVEVDTQTGSVRVKRFCVAHDCGQIINPDGLRNQIEGNVVQTVSRTLIEQVTFDRSRVTSLDWASYPILRFPDAPQVVMDLIDRPHEKPWGAGEPTAAVVPAAIANAIYDAVGIRMRSVPFTPEKVLAALKQA
ncbi:MAG: molybdopterin cofactor-binding domain-containing protein [Myxococcaceae bacterium]